MNMYEEINDGKKHYNNCNVRVRQGKGRMKKNGTLSRGYYPRNVRASQHIQVAVKKKINPNSDAAVVIIIKGDSMET